MPIMTRGRIVIDVPAEVAWALLADYANDPLWRKGVDRMEQTPAGPVFDGAPVTEELRFFGRLTRTQIEVHDVRPGTGFAWRAVDGTHAHGVRTITPLEAGRCELFTEREIGLAGADRLLQPIVSWVMARDERANVRRAAALLADRLRGGPAEG